MAIEVFQYLVLSTKLGKMSRCECEYHAVHHMIFSRWAKIDELVESLLNCHCEEWSDETISQIQVLTVK